MVVSNLCKVFYCKKIIMANRNRSPTGLLCGFKNPFGVLWWEAVLVKFYGWSYSLALVGSKLITLNKLPTDIMTIWVDFYLAMSLLNHFFVLFERNKRAKPSVFIDIESLWVFTSFTRTRGKKKREKGKSKKEKKCK